MRRQAFLVLVMAVILFTSTPGYSEILYEVIDLGVNQSQARSINDIGQVVGHSYPHGGNSWATLFDSTNNANYILLEDERSSARSINNNGQIVGYSEDGKGAILFDPSGEGNDIYLGDLNGDIYNQGYAHAINDNGQIVGTARAYSEKNHAVLFDPTGGQRNIDLGTIGGDVSTAYSINSNGDIVGSGLDVYGNTHPVLFDPTGAKANIDLGTLGGDYGSAWSINDNGQIVGVAAISGTIDTHAVLFDPTGGKANIDLGTLGGDRSFAGDINNAGQIVGGAFWDHRQEYRATLFDSTGSGQNINLNTLIAHSEDPSLSWRLEWAYDINNHGWIVGGGKSPDGEQHAFLLIPILSLLTPNGGEDLVSGTTCTISWKIESFDVPMLAEFSTDNGDTWESIDIITDKSFDWIVPDVDSSECLIRVSDSLNPSNNDTSDAVFKISAYEKVYFADENLKAAVEAELGIENPNTNDMLSLTRLEAQDLGVTDLTGLEFAENLSVLYLYYNEITDLGPIAELSNLTYVHSSHNQIEVIPDLSSWTNIRNLYLYHNKISDISPLTNPVITDLRYLRIYDNEVLPIEAYRDYIPAIKANNPKLVELSYDYPCEPMLVGDLNNDCMVNLADLAMMASDWLRCSNIYQELCQ